MSSAKMNHYRNLQPLDIMQAGTQYFPATSADNFMARTALMLPDCFAHWIDQHMPEIRGVNTVTFLSCGRGEIPFDSFPGLSGMMAGRGGFTLWNKVYLRRRPSRIDPLNPCDPRTVWLVLHELAHVETFRRNPVLFPIRYVARYIAHGYFRHPDEIDANRRADALRDLYYRENPCKCERTW